MGEPNISCESEKASHSSQTETGGLWKPAHASENWHPCMVWKPSPLRGDYLIIIVLRRRRRSANHLQMPCEPVLREEGQDMCREKRKNWEESWGVRESEA